MRSVSRWLSYLLLTVALLFELVLAANGQVGAPASSAKAPQATEQSSHQIPFQLFGNLVYVPVRVNNSAPLWFILDSGVDSYVIDDRRARALGLKLEGEDNASGVGENVVKISFARNVSFSLGDVEFPKRNLIAYPFANLERRAGHAIDGVLGAGVFKRFVVEINYATQTVTLHDPKTYDYDGQGESLPITVEGELPFIRAKIVLPGRDPIECKLLIDTGGNPVLGLNRPFVDEHKLLDSVTKTLTTTEVGARGEAKGRLGRIKTLQLGRFVIENPTTGFSESKTGALAVTSNNGLIGGALLRRFKLILDYSRKRAILESNEHFAEPYETGMSGALLTAEGTDLRTFTIYQIIENSPAADAGLLAGDIIVSIDGKPATEFNLDEVSRMFKQEGRSYALSVKRGEQTLRVEIKLRRLI